MAELYVEPSSFQGSLRVPSSKSHTLRAILFAALARGVSEIKGALVSPDTTAMIEAVRRLGAEITWESDVLRVRGVGGNLQVADDVIQCGNSGLVLRLIGALAGLIPHYTVLTGDDSIRHHRDTKPLLDGLNQLGAVALSSRGDGYAPLLIRGPFTNRLAKLQGEDSQPVSGLLIAAAFAPFSIEIQVTDAGEKPWVDMTLDWFRRLGIEYQAQDHTFYRMKGSSQINGFNYVVPGDFSTALFPIVGALITNSEITVTNLDMGDVQGDKAVISVLQQMGASFVIDAEKRSIKVMKGSRLKGARIDVNPFIDALPILAVLGCFAEGKTEIVNGAIARKKESDRIASIAAELKKMGAQIEELPSGLVVHSSSLCGTKLLSYSDHRLALSLAVAAFSSTGPSIICPIECIDKTYPNFIRDFQWIGARMRL